MRYLFIQLIIIKGEQSKHLNNIHTFNNLTHSQSSNMNTSSQNKIANEQSKYDTALPSLGEERLKSDYRMYGGLLLTLGLCAAYGSFADIVSLSGNPTASQGLPLATLVAAVLQAFFGIICMGIGFMALVMDNGSKTLTTVAATSIQLAWLPFLVGLSTIGKGIVSDPGSNPFIPAVYNPSSTDVKFVGSMSFLALVAYAIGYIGALGFMSFSMHAIQAGKPQDRSGLYFRGRAKMYNSLLMLAGFTQLVIGIFIINKYGSGPLAEPIFAVVYPVIFFPEICVTVGLIQILTGAIGVARALSKSQDESSVCFQALCFFMYVCMISMQILSQIAFAPGGTAAAAAPTLGCVMFGISFMPAFLDWKMRNVPDNLEG